MSTVRSDSEHLPGGGDGHRLGLLGLEAAASDEPSGDSAQLGPQDAEEHDGGHLVAGGRRTSDSMIVVLGTASPGEARADPERPTQSETPSHQALHQPTAAGTGDSTATWSGQRAQRPASGSLRVIVVLQRDGVLCSGVMAPLSQTRFPRKLLETFPERFPPRNFFSAVFPGHGVVELIVEVCGNSVGNFPDASRSDSAT